MLKIAGFLLISLAFGAVLAWAGMISHFPLGGLGAAALVAWAILARRRWEGLKAADGSDPGAPERMVWQRLAGTAMISAHLATVLLNPHIDLHVGQGNYLALDNWTLIVGVMVSAFVFRADRHERDERDDRIDARGTRWGYGILIALLVVLLLYMGFAPRPWQSALTHWILANALIALILVSFVARQCVQLSGYAQDRSWDRS